MNIVYLDDYKKRQYRVRAQRMTEVQVKAIEVNRNIGFTLDRITGDGVAVLTRQLVNGVERLSVDSKGELKLS